MLETLRYYQETKKYVTVYRHVTSKSIQTSRGYILDVSDNFFLMQETDDFKALGYSIFPIGHVTKLRHNRADKYYDKIMHWENEIDNIKINYKVVIDSWISIYNSLKDKKLNVIIECEDHKISSFTIGPIAKVGKKKIYINNFDAAGVLDEEPTAIIYTSISKVMFDDRYINVFSKYLRQKKVKS